MAPISVLPQKKFESGIEQSTSLNSMAEIMKTISLEPVSCVKVNIRSLDNDGSFSDCYSNRKTLTQPVFFSQEESIVDKDVQNPCLSRVSKLTSHDVSYQCAMCLEPGLRKISSWGDVEYMRVFFVVNSK
ncbi:hypothetical protein Tco_0452286 [Tanacetum coccineum]